MKQCENCKRLTELAAVKCRVCSGRLVDIAPAQQSSVDIAAAFIDALTAKAVIDAFNNSGDDV